MLKIKDNVDLKELEKYGFILNFNNQYVKDRIVDGERLYVLYVTPTHHYIQIKVFVPCTIAGSIQDTIYDLIKADLVEKVEE